MNKLQSIKKACKITDLAYSQVLKKIKIGITEKEIAKEVGKIFKQNNSKLAFRSIIAFGKNVFEIHHKPTNKKLSKNDGFVLIDIGAKVNDYCADMSRTVFFGKATNEQKKMYRTVLETQERTIKQLNNLAMKQWPIKVYELDKIARDYIVKKGFDPIPHPLGHGVGKKVHEKPKISPISNELLEDGAIFTIEPGIYIKGVGGVRIENVFYLKSGKLIQLTKSPKELLEI